MRLLCQVLINISCVSGKKRILKVVNLSIFTISLSSPLGKGLGPSFEKLESLTNVACVVEIDLVVGKLNILKLTSNDIFTSTLLLPKNELCPVWLNLAKGFHKSCNFIFFIFLYHLLLKRDMTLLYEQNIN